GDPAAGRKILDDISAGADGHGVLTVSRWDLAMLERNYTAAEKILADASPETLAEVGDPTKAFHLGRLASARGDNESAQRYFAMVTSDAEKRVSEDPASAERRDGLALLYAYMHRKEDAIREARRAVELEPESQNAFHGTAHAAILALTYALNGEPDQAIALIERLLSTP